jgi:hypothetical protein
LPSANQVLPPKSPHCLADVRDQLANENKQLRRDRSVQRPKRVNNVIGTMLGHFGLFSLKMV